MVKRWIIFLLIFCPSWLFAQLVEFAEPQRLSSNINSKDEESMPLVSPDRKTLFFTRSLFAENVGGKYSGQDIWVSELVGDSWGKADNLKTGLNTNSNNAVIGISADGNVLYLMDATSTKKNNGIYFSKRESKGWGHAEFIPIDGLLNNSFINFYVAPTYDVIFISMKGVDSQGEEDLYFSVKDNNALWTKPKNLGTTINTKGFEISPFLSADKKILYFSSSGHPGLGDADIFYSERLYDSWENWSAPKNLGDKINSKNFDAYFSIRDSMAYFSSNRNNQFADIYQTSFKKIVDNKKEQVNKIVAQAKSLLTDLNKLNEDSTENVSESVFLSFDFNSAELNARAIRQITRVIDVIGDRKPPKITLYGDSFDFDAESLNDELSYKRIEKIKEYIDGVSKSKVKFTVDQKRREKRVSGNKNGVELRYKP